LKQWGMLIASAGVLAVCMPGFGFSFPIWVGFSVFLIILKRCSPWKGFIRGILFGMIYFGICLHWIIPTFYNEIPNMFERFPSEVGIVVYLLLCLIQSFFFGLFGAIYCAFYPKIEKRLWLFLLFIPSLLVFTELLRGWGPMGFTGYRFSDSLYRDFGLLQIAAFGGNELLLWIIGFTNAWVAYAWGRGFPSFRLNAVRIGLLCIGAAYLVNSLIIAFIPPTQPHMAEKTKIAVMQPWVEPREKYRYSEFDFIRSFEASISDLIQTRKDVDLIVFPESHFQYDIAKSPMTLQVVEATAREIGIPIVVPHPKIEDQRYYNAVRIVYPFSGLSTDFYGKMKLTPFVETLPYGDLFRAFEFLMLYAYFEEGPDATVFEVANRSIGFPICFESLYPEVFSAFHQNHAEILVVVTNDGWFGNLIGLETHFAFLPFRAVENRRWMLQVSNNGITGLVDPYGRIIQRLPPFESSWDVFEVPVDPLPSTPYIAYRNIWLTIFLLLLLITSILSFVIQ